MQYFIEAMQKYAEFTGRARRKQFWMFYLFVVIFSIACGIVDLIIGASILGMLFSLAMLIPTLSIGARRLHDTGRSGWWQLLYLLPLIGAIVLLVFFVLDSHDDNQFGANPKASAA